MAANDAFADDGEGREFGSVLECTEGAIWKAVELENSLR